MSASLRTSAIRAWVGAGLAASGVAMQAFFRNALAKFENAATRVFDPNS